MIFQNILTTVGQQKRAIAESGGASVNITHFKIGDSNGQYYEPIESQTDLVNTKYTANFTGQSQILVSPTSSNEVLYKCFVPAEIGGFTIRELGLFDSNNDLILICKLPAQDKFALDSGLYQPLTFTPKIIFTNPQTQAVLTVSSQIIATQNFVSEQISDLIGGHTTDPDAHLGKFEVIEDEFEAHIADKFIHGDHLPLFFPMAMPKLLTGDEALGWGLQGTSHTGAVYETAYNALAEAFVNGTATTDTILISNINSVNVTKTVNCKLYNGMRVVDVENIAQVNDLYTATGSQPYFVIDTTNQTFTLPKNENAIRFTTDTSKGGLYSKDQIVNITGIFPTPTIYGSYSGVFYPYSDIGMNGSASHPGKQVGFDTSRVVNTGTQVQGRSVNYFLYYKIGNIIANEALIDIGNFQSEIDLKADKDLSNITEYGKNFIKNIVPLSKLWTSVEYASSGVQTVSVPVEIDLNKCIVQVLLKCSVAQGNYSVGDYAPYNWSSGSDSNWNGANIDLTNRTIQATGGNTLFIPYKNAIGYFGGSSANWRFVFKILY